MMTGTSRHAGGCANRRGVGAAMSIAGAAFALCVMVGAAAPAQTPTPAQGASPAAAAATGAPAPASGRSEIEIKHGVSMRPKMAIAVPNPTIQGAKPGLFEGSATLRDVLRNDLDWSGVFSLLSPSYYDLVPPHDASAIPYHEWASIGAEYLVHLTTSVEDGQFVCEARVYEVKSGRNMVLQKRYRTEFSSARYVAHMLSDSIVLQLTGVNGVASTRLVFVSDRTGGRAREIFMMDYDGFNQIQVTRNGSLNMSPDWSPDNDTLVYTSYARGFPDLYALSKGASAGKAIVSGREFHSAPAWSPDGNTIAFTTTWKSDTEVFLCDRNGGSHRRLTISAGIDTSPAWSPTGREIAFTSERSGRKQIWITDAEGLNPRMLTREGDNDSAAWSPDGSKMAYVARHGISNDIMVYDVKTGQDLQLTQDTGSNESPTWSPDSRLLAFESSRNGSKQVYVMEANGANLHAVTSAGQNSQPDWSHWNH